MRLPGRLITLLTGVAIAATAALSARPHGPASARPVAVPSTQPCLPAPGAGVLPSPPVIDTTIAGNASFDLYVKRGVTVPGGQVGGLYCYVTTKNGDTSYVEAPTIRVRQGGTFTMTLRNLIPYDGPSPIPTPPQKILRVPGDDCAWLPYDSAALPPPNPNATPPGYFGHQRVQQNPSPPWMLGNDTNFHTHGWHVSPYVDNVYKSLVWAPARNVCVFKFTVRRSQPPGSYWYHAHLHGLSDNQVGGGLGGALIVVPNGAPPRATHEDGDVVLLIKNAARGQTATPSPSGTTNAHPMAAMTGMSHHGDGRPVVANHYAALAAAAGTPSGPPATAPVSFNPFSPPPARSGWPFPAQPAYCAAIPTDATQGQPLAVNGALMPAVYGGTTYPATPPAVTQPPGTMYRYRIINASADTFVNVRTLAADGTYPMLNIVGRDGVPVNWNRQTSSIDVQQKAIVREPNVMVPPSGRVDILVAGSTTPLRIISAAGTPTPTSASGTPYCTGYLGFAMPQRIIVAINPTTTTRRPRALLAARALETKPGVTAAGRYVQQARARNVVRRAITFTMYRDGGPTSPPTFNWLVTETGAQTAPFAPNPTPLPYVERPFWLAQRSTPPNPSFPYVPWIQVHQGDFEEWSLINASGEIHAFHIHQLTFVATQSPFEATDPTRQVFLDSIALPAATIAAPQTASPGPTPAPQTSFPLLVPSVTKIQIDFNNVDTGVFVFHCHMLFHEDHGMMGVIEVLPPRNNAPRQKTF
jgi:FtsP/CotA-like multicopper oxidase with cupredoxin domain